MTDTPKDPATVPDDKAYKFKPFMVGEKAVASVNIRRLSFEQFIAIGRAAQAMKQPTTMEGRVLRARMVMQVDYLDAHGKAYKFEIADLLRMPAPVARRLQTFLLRDDGVAGNILGDGDGVGQAIRYELGEPIEIKGKDPIIELEFRAETYGELEDVISGEDALDQTLALIKIAKPVHESLQSLPSWAVSNVSLADGLTIAQKILPRFLEE